MKTIARVERNCWGVAEAERLAVLVDAHAYFEQLAAALERAQRSILIVGWDLHSAVRLRRGSDSAEGLAATLERLVRQRPELQVHLLVWDCNVFCLAVREKLQTLRLGWQTSSRIHYHRDSSHPPGACHHEKIVVIDDALAFVGGIDLTACRWDTSDHAADYDARVDPSGDGYRPFHDVQVAVSGAAARELARAVRERWRRATGERLQAPETANDPWPGEMQPNLRNVKVGLARTDAAEPGRPAVREIEELYRDALASARESIYIENQYLSSDAICQSLVELLKRQGGPEICIVVPLRVSGWLEETVMGRLRSRIVARLRAADRQDRLRIWYPEREAAEDPIVVHSKLCIVDRHFLTVGSANLSNRSMGLDTECNVFVEAGGERAIGDQIAGLRHRLLGEHLDCEPAEVAAAIEASGSLNRAVESLRGKRRTLAPLEIDPEDAAAEPLTHEQLLDPEQPLEWGELVRRFFVTG